VMRYQIVPPVDDPVLQGSDGTFSHGGASPGFYAIDYGSAIGTPIRAAADGTVRIIYWQDSNPISLRTGHSTYIEHDNGYATFSCHQTTTNVAVGDRVVQGQIIGTTGDPASQPGNGYGSGPHLHWEIWNPSYFAGGARVKMEDLLAAGIAGPWNGAPVVEDLDMKVETTFDDGILARQWKGPSTVAVFKKIGGYDGNRGIDQGWAGELKAGRPLGFAISPEEEDKASGRIVRYFSNGRVTYFPADGSVKIN
jgi:murein DD-endopeptidase MepM/ murein hydrolase activator NlpD